MVAEQPDLPELDLAVGRWLEDCSLQCWLKSPTWKAHTGSKRKPPDADRSRSNLADNAVRRDGHKCRLCEFSVVVEVHHIKPVHRGGRNVLANVITLCPNHHAMADRGLIEAEALFGLVPRCR